MVSAFDPAELLRTLAECEVDFVLIGGLAATLYGSPYVTTDADIVPEKTPENMERLSKSLRLLEAKIRTEGEPAGLPFDMSATALENLEILNLTTRFGNLDLTFMPSGTSGFPDLRRDAKDLTVHGVHVHVASLADVIRSKEAANRDKDRLVLPTLRDLLRRLEDPDSRS